MSGDVLARLHRERPRSPFIRASIAAGAALVIASWLTLDVSLPDLLSERRLANLRRFLGELVPYPLRGAGFDPIGLATWAGELLVDRGFEAALITLAIAAAAIALAAAVAVAVALPAARNMASEDPFLGAAYSARPLKWRLLSGATRSALILARGLPEYVLAFLFVGLIGPVAGAAVLALAVHNAGILGKLAAETIEDLEPPAPAALRAVGAGRRQIALVAVLPLVLPRLLVYLFYRWETCVREATVLGTLGVVSIGWWIVDARARNHYDEMLAFVLVGAGLVVLGDLVSALARRAAR
jgi:phosphonate transport system permease protein